MKNSVQQQYKLGIAIAAETQLSFLPELGEFQVLEINGELLEYLDRSRTELNGFERIAVRDLAPRRVLNELPEVSFGVKNDFFTLFAQRCALMAQYNIDRGTLGVDLDKIGNDADFADAAAEVVRCCCGIAAKQQVALGVEYRIPGLEERGVEVLREFRSKVGYPCFVMLDFHPHESGSLDALAGLEGKLPFDSALWQISFDGASGNYPGSEVIRRVSAAVRRNSWRPPEVIYAPGQWADKEVFMSLVDQLGTVEQE